MRERGTIGTKYRLIWQLDLAAGQALVASSSLWHLSFSRAGQSSISAQIGGIVLPTRRRTLTSATLDRPLPNAVTETGQQHGRVLGPYLGYVGYFVGAGLISGGIVHQPLDPARYTTIALAGVGVFLAATVLNEFVLAPQRPTGVRAARLILASLALSLGIGMLSGGIQHFSDFPERAAVLIPVGIVLSFLAYVARSADKPLRTVGSWTGVAIVVVAAAAALLLQPLAASFAVDGGGHGHGAAESGATDHAPAAEQPAADVPAADVPAATDPSHPHHTGGH